MWLTLLQVQATYCDDAIWMHIAYTMQLYRRKMSNGQINGNLNAWLADQ